jgi:excisionase family DNA binding protein
MEKLYTPDEVADALRVTRRSVYEWLKTGRLRGLRAGNRWRIREEDVHAFTRADRHQMATETQEERDARILAIAGKYADIPWSSEDYMREKHAEHEKEMGAFGDSSIRAPSYFGATVREIGVA